MVEVICQPQAFTQAQAATVDQLERAIFDSCTRPNDADPERAGLGVPDASAALQVILT